MQEIKKRRIVIASVLKPVNDTRMYEKLGITLSKVADVHISGFPAPTVSQGDVVFHASRAFPRISWQRLFQPWRVLGLLISLRPTDIIVCTHELLLPAAIYKILNPCDLFYDLQENYGRNIMFTKAFPAILRPLLAGYVRLKERLLHGFVRKYLVAERCYIEEMPFIRNKSIVLENRFCDLRNESILSSNPKKDGKTLLFSGTLSRSTGVFAAIGLAKKLWAFDREFRLTIAGFCPRETEYRELIKQIEGCPFITLHGGNVLLPHQEIVLHIRASDFGVISYDITPATESRIPTKLFEYLANGLSIITRPHPPWMTFIRQYQEPVVFDPANLDASALLEQMSQRPHVVMPDRRGLLWSEVEPELLRLFTTPARQMP